MTEIALTTPAQVIAGDTWQWSREWSDYPAPTWTLTYFFQNLKQNFSLTASASSSAHLITETATNSAQRAAGTYSYFARVTDGTSVVTVETGEIEVRPDPAASVAQDYRTSSRRILDAIDATLFGKATADQQSVVVGGRQISRIPIPDLTKLREYYEAKVNDEKTPGRVGGGRVMKIRHARP